MCDKQTNQVEADLRPVYEPPRALRLDDARTGTGQSACDSPGSSAGGCFGSGSGAASCEQDGNSPLVNCVDSGSGEDS
ncbi:hypothetical protein ACFLT5_00495 [Chloroflexota bacterium]